MGDKNQITKPFGLIRKETQDAIVKTINECGLPLSVSMYILKDIMEQISVAVAQQESTEIAEYEAKLAEFNKQE